MAFVSCAPPFTNASLMKHARQLDNHQGSKFKLGTRARCRIARLAEHAEYCGSCESSRPPEVGEVPHQPERHIFPRRQFGKSKVVSRAFQVVEMEKSEWGDILDERAQ